MAVQERLQVESRTNPSYVDEEQINLDNTHGQTSRLLSTMIACAHAPKIIITKPRVIVTCQFTKMCKFSYRYMHVHCSARIPQHSTTALIHSDYK